MRISAPSRTFLLLPGAGGEWWYWHRVAPLLRDQRHDVISPDLPASDDSAGLAEYGDAALDAVGGHQGPRGRRAIDGGLVRPAAL